jgi:hypothetical protein
MPEILDARPQEGLFNAAGWGGTISVSARRAAVFGGDTVAAMIDRTPDDPLLTEAE